MMQQPSKKAGALQLFIAIFLVLINLPGTSILFSPFGGDEPFCQMAVFTTAGDSVLTMLMKALLFRGPGFGVDKSDPANVKEVDAWQRNFDGECPPAPAGFTEQSVLVDGKASTQKRWVPDPAAIVLEFCTIALLAYFFFFKKNQFSKRRAFA